MTNNPGKKRILVVEDEQFLRDLYVELLTEEGYDVESASDGEKAYKMIQDGYYDLILLDVVLPKKDGLAVLKDLKANPPKKPSKAIIVLSNLGHEAVISEGVSLGIRGHIIKSDYTPDQLLSEVKRVIDES